MGRLARVVAVVALVSAGLSTQAGRASGQTTTPDGSGLTNEAQYRQQHAEEFQRTHKDSAGNLRPDLWRKGIAQEQQMKTTNMQGQTIAGNGQVSPNTAPGVVGAAWTQIGPAPVRVDQDQIYQGSGPDSGQVVDVAIDPSGTTDKIVYIAANDGGIWKTTNGDAAPASVTWTPLTDNMPSNSMGAVALDPTNPSIVYAGTGNSFNNGFFKGIGIYRSTDGGNSWTQPAGNSVLTNKAIYRIVLPATNVLLVATNGGLFKSVDGGTSYGNNSPSFNNGSPVLAGDVTDVHLGTEGGGKVYASTRSATLVRSTDSGSTFGANLFDANIPAGSGYTSFSQARGNPKIIYANVQTPNIPNPGTPPPATIPDGKIFKTTNGDQANPTWSEVAAGTADAKDNGGCQCGYDQTIGVDPQDDNTVYIGFQELYVTTDGGSTWPKVSANKIHWDHHALTFSPSTHWTGAPTRAWQGQDGGVSYTTDRGANFANPNEGGLATNLFRGIDIGRGSSTNRGFSYGGTQDTGILDHTDTTPGTDWHLTRDGDGGLAAVDPCNAKHAISSDNSRFSSTPDITTTRFSFGGGGFGTNPGVGVELFDPNCGSNKAYLAFGGSALYQSTDNAGTFSSIHTFPANITSMAMRAGSSDTMWVGLDDGTTQRTSNLTSGASSTWTSHSVTGAPVGQQIGGPGGITMDPTDTTGNTVVVTYEGFTNQASGAPSKHVFRTTDGGTNWTDISGTDGAAADVLPDLPTHSVVIDPDSSPHGIIVSNDAGVLRTSDNGASWQRLGTDLPTVDATQLQIDPGASPTLLRVGTYGRSAFELTGDARADLSITKTDSPDPVFAGNNLTYTITVKNNGPNDAHTVSMTDALNGPATFVSETHPAGWTCVAPAAGGNGVYNCTRSALAVGDGDQTFTVVMRVPANTANNTTLNNTAAVASGTLDTNTSNNSASASTQVQTRADIQTVKTAPAGPVAPTSNMTYGITVTNHGPSDAQSATMSDTLPSGIAFVSETHPVGWTCTDPPVGAGGTVSCSKAVMAAGEVASFSIVVHVAPTVPSGTNVSNTASASSATTDPDTTNNSSTATTLVACAHSLTGNFPSTLDLNGGSWCLNAVTVGSTTTVEPGTLVIITNSDLHSSFTAKGAGNVALCHTTVRSTVNVSGATGFVLIGDPGDDLCPGNTLYSTVNLTNNTAGVELAGNPRIGNQVTVSGNSGTGPFPDDNRPEIESNTILGGLACSGNTPAASNDGHPNSVSGARSGECGAPGF